MRHRRAQSFQEEVFVKPRTFDARETAKLLPYGALADAIGAALLEYSRGRVNVPERLILELPAGAARPCRCSPPGGWRRFHPELVGASSVVVDTLHAAREEAGDLIGADREGVWGWERARTLAEVLAGPRLELPGPILFKSVGHALFDLASARVALLG
jgi:ornithine cyclodeaminase/alanine dehydrogenase-like protein (mu-crystallin family)